MNVIIIEHARDRMGERGVVADEVGSVLESGATVETKGRRKSREAIFPFAGLWHGRSFPHKKVRVVYVEEGQSLVVITVYAFYGRWSAE